MSKTSNTNININIKTTILSITLFTFVGISGAIGPSFDMTLSNRSNR